MADKNPITAETIVVSSPLHELEKLLIEVNKDSAKMKRDAIQDSRNAQEQRAKAAFESAATNFAKGQSTLAGTAAVSIFSLVGGYYGIGVEDNSLEKFKGKGFELLGSGINQIFNSRNSSTEGTKANIESLEKQCELTSRNFDESKQNLDETRRSSKSLLEELSQMIKRTADAILR